MEANEPPPSWHHTDETVLKYVDDLIAIEKLFTGAGIFSVCQKKRLIDIHATGSQSFFERVKMRAEAMGMTVNENKTQMICISAAVNSDVNSYIRLLDGTKMVGQEALKQLGFVFGMDDGF